MIKCILIPFAQIGEVVPHVLYSTSSCTSSNVSSTLYQPSDNVSSENGPSILSSLITALQSPSARKIY